MSLEIRYEYEPKSYSSVELYGTHDHKVFITITDYAEENTAVLRLEVSEAIILLDVLSKVIRHLSPNKD